jgi:hypothetical protein
VRVVSSVRQRVAEQDSEGITGTVVDAAGGPIVGAQLGARAEGSSSAWVEAMSNEQGEFRIVVPRGATELWAESEGYTRAWLSLAAPADGARLVLVPASVVSGRVVDARTRVGVAAAVVTAHPLQMVLPVELRVMSNAEGEFSFTALAPGSYELEASNDAFRTERQELSLELGEARDSVVLVAERAASVSAELWASGAPCAEGQLELTGPVYALGSTSEQGQVKLGGLPAGRYQLVAACTGARSVEQALEVGLENTALRFELEPGLSVRGRVMNGLEQGAGGVVVQVKPADVDAERSLSLAGGGTHCVSDSTGRFMCSGLSEGSYDCSAAAAAGGVSDSVRVLVADRAAPEVVLHLGSVGTIEAVLEGAAASATGLVAIARPLEGSASTATLRDGRFVFAGLALGTYDVLLDDSAEGGAAAPIRTELASEGEVVRITLPALPAAAPLRGRVIDASGEPVPDASVHATPSREMLPETSVLSDDGGYFEFTGLSPSAYDVVATSSFGASVVQRVGARSRSIELRIERFARLSGTASSASGEPLAAFIVHYERDGVSNSTQGTDGRWSATGLAPGAYALHLASSAGSGDARVHLAAGEEAALSLVVTRTEASDADEGRDKALPAAAGGELNE